MGKDGHATLQGPKTEWSVRRLPLHPAAVAVYDPDVAKDRYPGQAAELGTWVEELRDHLVCVWQQKEVRKVWQGSRFTLTDPSLASDRSDHFAQLWLLLPA